MRLTGLCFIVAAALTGSACTHARNGPVTDHFATFRVPAPNGNTVYVCHAYGCQMQTKFRFTDADIAELRSLMAKTRKADSVSIAQLYCRTRRPTG